jgi:hypothetical protein
MNQKCKFSKVCNFKQKTLTKKKKFNDSALELTIQTAQPNQVRTSNGTGQLHEFQ